MLTINEATMQSLNAKKPQLKWWTTIRTTCLRQRVLVTKESIRILGSAPNPPTTNRPLKAAFCKPMEDQRSWSSSNWRTTLRLQFFRMEFSFKSKNKFLTSSNRSKEQKKFNKTRGFQEEKQKVLNFQTLGRKQVSTHISSIFKSHRITVHQMKRILMQY